MGDLTQPQRDAAMAVLKAALSEKGYEKVQQIVQADEVLKDGDGGGRGGPGGGPGGPGGPGGRGGPGGGRGGGANFGRDNYCISLLGKPSTTDPWMIQFGGHHLGLNITFAGQRSTLAPSHTGAQPAIYEIEGKEVRPLGHEVDKAFALLTSLDETSGSRPFSASKFATWCSAQGTMVRRFSLKESKVPTSRKSSAKCSSIWRANGPELCTNRSPPQKWPR